MLYRRCWWKSLLAIVSLTLLSLAHPVQACGGDCDGSGEVTVDELVTMINIALGNLPLPRCAAGDGNLDGSLTVEEIVRAVNLSLAGCPLTTATPTSTASATPSSTPTPTPSVTPTASKTPTPSATATPTQPFGASFSFDFRNGTEAWQVDFADYPEGQDAFFELVAEIRTVPPESGSFGDSYFISGNNHSDDLFSFLTFRLGRENGLQANQRYRLSFRLRLASNAPSGCSGIGGAPGESVFLKAGASPRPPTTFIDGAGDVRVDVDKGNQGTSGSEMSVAGNIANGIPCEQADLEQPPYVSLLLSHQHPIPVQSSAAGDLWLIVGTDSGFEGTTALHYQRIGITLEAVAEN